MKKFEDLTGNKFGYLTVIKKCGTKLGKRMWLCKCVCGGTTVTSTGSLRSGKTKSCGCRRLENSILASKKKNTKHGMRFTRIYRTWCNMKDRCLNSHSQQYCNYGGRGIRVCDEWLEFKNFYRDMGNQPDGMTIERIDVNGGYCKENCVWATVSEQANNKRTNRNVTYGGKTMTISQWEKEMGVKAGLLRDRICRFGWTVERAMTEKPHEKRKKA